MSERGSGRDRNAAPALPFDEELRRRYPEIDQAIESLDKPALPAASELHPEIDRALDSLEQPAAPPYPYPHHPHHPHHPPPSHHPQQGWGGWGPPPPGYPDPRGGPAHGVPHPSSSADLAAAARASSAFEAYAAQRPLSAAAVPARTPPARTEESSEVLITLRDIVKTYERGGETLQILSGLTLQIQKGSFAALMGPSGSGKSTLLNIIAGLDLPTSGAIDIGGVRVDKLSERKLAAWRADKVGFVYQQYNLLPVMTALENVELPLLLTKVPRRERRARARTALRIVGLEERMGHFPRQLSGGQEQRVAIARAIVNDPAIIVADEPTGDLDRNAADDILFMLEKLAREFGKTIVMVTHDPAAAARAFVIHRLDKGKIFA